MDSADDFYQGGGGGNLLATAREKFFTRTNRGGLGNGDGLHIGGRVPLRQPERGSCVDAGLVNGGGDKYVCHDNFKRGD